MKLGIRSRTIGNRDWTLIAGATLLAFALGGCRFGNRVVTSDASADPISGFYGTSPQTLKFCASHPETRCIDMPTNQVPTLISAQMSNPVALIVQDAGTGDAALTAYNGGRSALPVWLGADNATLYFASSYSPRPLWKDSSCMSRMYLEEEGAIVPGESLPVPGSSRSTNGRITLRVRVTEAFIDSTDGSCRIVLQAMANCYQDVNQCGGLSAADNAAYRAQAVSVFDPYVQAGAMTAADIANGTSLAYEIQYQ